MGKGKGKRKVHSGKRSRFSLSPRGELALAGIGVIVLGILAFLGWSLLAPMILKPDHAKAAAEQKERAQMASRWESMTREGTVLREDPKRCDVMVDGAKWEALGLSGQGEAAQAASAHFGEKRCFVYDAATGAQLGWYTEAEGYKRTGR